jgi:hypothetical protein
MAPSCVKKTTTRSDEQHSADVACGRPFPHCAREGPGHARRGSGPAPARTERTAAEGRPLSPLIATGLRDVPSTHPSRPTAALARTGTAPGAEDQLRAALPGAVQSLSPALFNRATGDRVFRTGVWGGKNGTPWSHYPKMTAAVHAASDHAAIYAGIDI